MTTPKKDRHLHAVPDQEEAPLVRIDRSPPGAPSHDVNRTIVAGKPLVTDEQRAVARRNQNIRRGLWGLGGLGFIGLLALTGQVGTDPGDAQPPAPTYDEAADGTPNVVVTPDAPPVTAVIGPDGAIYEAASGLALPGEVDEVNAALLEENGGPAVMPEDIAALDHDDGHAAIITPAELRAHDGNVQAALDDHYVVQEQG